MYRYDVEYVEMMVDATDQDPDEILSDLAKHSPLSAEEWEALEGYIHSLRHRGEA